MLKVFIEKVVYFRHALKSFGLYKNSFQIVIKLNQININKKAKSI